MAKSTQDSHKSGSHGGVIHGSKGPDLFDPMSIRGMRVRNRIWLPPMDTYSVFARDGKPTPFHYQHYVSRAMGGFGLIIAEATAVSPEGRISPCDVGLWNDDQVEAWRWIVRDVRDAGAAMGVQLNHAGRKGSTGCVPTGHIAETVPPEEGGWETVGPSADPYGRYAAPRALDGEGIRAVISDFASAATRAVAAGFQFVEIHAAHGYLISQFLDPLVNHRDDEYGGDLEGRALLLIRVVDAVRAVIPEDMPLFVRVSATDWAPGGWDLDQTIALSRTLASRGVDLIDVSTGGIVPGVAVPVEPGYQVPFARKVRQGADVPVTAVGLITKPKQAKRILRNHDADAVEIGRAALRDPYWPLRAAHKLGIDAKDAPYPFPYQRGAF
jgi:2,4-dienoyl-CoA reductase-like NADH-dependent reductase (Old Yellow Enzyme family)